MTKNEKWFLFLANFLSVGTGLVLAWMIYFLRPVNEWDVFNHPWQKYVQSLHIIVVPLLFFAVGIIWKNHIHKRLFKQTEARKFSGRLLVLILFPMIFSGYFLQISQEELWRTIYQQIHIWSSLIWSLTFLVHVFR